MWPTLSNLLPTAEAFSNLATRWQFSTPDSCKTLLISSLTKVWIFFRYRYYFSNQSWFVEHSIKNQMNFFQRNISQLSVCFSALLHKGLKIFNSDGATFLRSTWLINLEQKKNHKISVDIVREMCTVRFYIVSSEGFQQMH